ncbi:unnamed protein product [Brachionus calyciflorus]|uniref:Nudix hydrolase domain-containing protein n=1 Tax=Brachionus calyciflorus TaxID=104777 RepID=A0A814CR23_9BILA|nr:unnamed protein product [Brachionus calyciflorus]
METARSSISFEEDQKKKKENSRLKRNLKKKEYFKRKKQNKSCVNEKKVSRDIRTFYRRTFYELATKIDNLEKMNYKKLLAFLNENGISFDRTHAELRDLSRKEGLINYTMVYFPNEKIIKINRGDDFNEISQLVNLKKNNIKIESPSIYSNRTSAANSMIGDSGNIEQIEGLIPSPYVYSGNEQEWTSSQNLNLIEDNLEDIHPKVVKNTRQFNFLVGVSDLTQVQISEEHQAITWYSMFNMNKSNIAANDFLGGLYELPSGKVENGEDSIEALKREIKEETNLNVVSVIRYLGHFDYKSKSGALTRQFNYEVSTDSIENLKLIEEHEKADWISNSINAFKKLNVSINVREIIEKYFEDDEELIEEKKPSKRKVVETDNSNNKTKRL